MPEGYNKITRKPGTLKNPLATALPVSPEVATKIKISLSSLRCKYAISRAIKRAPKSLKANVGPWNNSSTNKSSLNGCNGASKSKASCTISRKAVSGTSSFRNKRAISNAISRKLMFGRYFRISDSRRGISIGMNSPPSGAKPLKTASFNETRNFVFFVE